MLEKFYAFDYFLAQKDAILCKARVRAREAEINCVATPVERIDVVWIK